MDATEGMSAERAPPYLLEEYYAIRIGMNSVFIIRLVAPLYPYPVQYCTVPWRVRL